MIPFSEPNFCQDSKSEKIIEFKILVKKLFVILKYSPASQARFTSLF